LINICRRFGQACCLHQWNYVPEVRSSKLLWKVGVIMYQS